MLIAGMRTFGNPPLNVADARVRAVIAMSPQGPAPNRDTTAQSWADVHVPIMYMTGTNDRGATEAEDYNWRKQAFEDSPAGVSAPERLTPIVAFGFTPNSASTSVTRLPTATWPNIRSRCVASFSRPSQNRCGAN